MRGDFFFDTNVLIYAVSKEDGRSKTAAACLALGGIVSVQVLNEFVAMSRRKLKRPWYLIREDLTDLAFLLPDPHPLSRTTHLEALRFAERDGFSFYDALIVASALEAGCSTLLTEDMQDGRVIDDQLTIRNPFTAGSPP
jgi:predicted nucleic acid-binding protein